MQEGLSETQIIDLEHYATSPHFSTREALALTYAERLTRSDQDVDEALFARLQQAFPTAAEIVELTAIVAFENFRSKFNHALQIESNGFCLLKRAGGMNEDRGRES
jgi:alkylhydroperoxidase family enzyme